MSEPRFKIVFDGSLLPGVEKNTAQLNLAELFKSDIASIERLFNGQPVELKRDLSQADADRYLEALSKTGIAARIEQEQLLDLQFDALVPPSPAPAPAPAASESPYAPPRATVGTSIAEFSTLKVMSFQGRIGRVRYLAWTLALSLAMMAVIGVGAMIGFASMLTLQSSVFAMIIGGLISIGLLVAFTVVAIQISVQRLHDLGWSGWLWLINFVPIVGGVFPFVLAIAPGNTTANRYGAPPPPNSTAAKVLAWMWIPLFVLIMVGTVVGGLSSLGERYSESTTSYSESIESGDADDASEPAESAAPAVDYDEEE